MTKIAHDIVIDLQERAVYIEGVEFDFHLEDVPVVTPAFGGRLARVTMSVFADNVVIGDRHVFSTTGQTIENRRAIESKWVERESKRIVHEGLAHVLEWLTYTEANYPMRYMAGLSNDSRATMLDPDNRNTD